ncbi:MAG: uroporphyrinogen-III C-methyltransferase, partial [Proteobacteria bacterium]|nr:uroporphyrinogen-III C-methyltransferase [Pseudomonadota bacterium]
KELADPRMYQLRALIADEQLALASVAKVDIEGMSIQLQSALDNVDDLTVLMAAELETDDASESESTLPEDWQSAASQAWNEVKSLVVIRHQQDGAAAVLVPEQRYFLYQNLTLKLESAQLALLSGEALIFKSRLASAEQWLQHYFVGDDRDAMLAMVTALQAESITVDLPDISASLVWIQQKGDQ